jgi:SMC interacting uncharacterized protein involved in chromosome segregation
MKSVYYGSSYKLQESHSEFELTHISELKELKKPFVLLLNKPMTVNVKDIENKRIKLSKSHYGSTSVITELIEGREDLKFTGYLNLKSVGEYSQSLVTKRITKNLEGSLVLDKVLVFINDEGYITIFY